MGHILDVVGQSVFRLDFQQTVFKSLVREVLWIIWVHNANPINNKAVGIHVGGSRSQRHGPQPCLCILLHGVAPSKLHINQHLFGLVVLVLECHRTIIIADGLGISLHTAGHEKNQNGFSLHTFIYLIEYPALINTGIYAFVTAVSTYWPPS